jgi:ParB family chromosome partitioning protein
MAKPALGRGLGALLGGGPSTAKPPANIVSTTAPAPSPVTPVAPVAATADIREKVERVALSRVQPCAFQPRKDFSEPAIRELADSIKEQGIVQPLIVRAKGDGFELIAGERRWRAAQLLGLKEIPVLVREADDRTVLELALIENLQRENLNAIEEALGYSQLLQQFALTQDEVATKVGRSRAVVANALRLLKLPDEVQAHVRDGSLSVGHAKVILGLASGEEQRRAAAKALKDGLNVRQTEALVAHLQAARKTTSTPTAPTAALPRDAHVADLETKLQQRLGTKVSLRYLKGKGSIEIRFFNDDDLDRVLDLLGVKVD